MNANELIKQLTECINKYGDLDVYIRCDHGQEPEDVFDVGVTYAAFEDNEVVPVHPDDYDEYDEGELEKIILIN